MENNIYNKVLMIDDDEDLAFIISEMLEGYGYQVTCAENSEKAFELLESNTYHVILLDINLPDADGFEICQELRRTSTTPVIFASARTSETDRITGFDIAQALFHERTAIPGECPCPPHLWILPAGKNRDIRQRLREPDCPFGDEKRQAGILIPAGV